MLVYVRDSSIDDTLRDVTDDDISKFLIARFAEEKYVMCSFPRAFLA